MAAKRNIAGAVFVVLVWLIALALAFLVLVKFNLLFRK